jgi:hypothetical protein
MVVTYESPRGQSRLTLAVRQIRLLEARGVWPHDVRGNEYCQVYQGQHRGIPDLSDDDLLAISW